jgi:hypothetical protein
MKIHIQFRPEILGINPAKLEITFYKLLTYIQAANPVFISFL